jgi:hypothetical protein
MEFTKTGALNEGTSCSTLGKHPGHLDHADIKMGRWHPRRYGQTEEGRGEVSIGVSFLTKQLALTSLQPRYFHVCMIQPIHSPKLGD